MSFARRTMVALAAVVGAFFAVPGFAAAPAFAAGPSLSVNSITFTPGGSEVRQSITYQGLPDHTLVHYSINRAFGDFALGGPAGTSCTTNAGAGFGSCSEVSGSGIITVAFGNDSASTVAFSASEVGAVTVSIESLSLVATGTVTAAPKADLAVDFSLAWSGASVSVVNYGPSVSAAETLRISGFTQVTNVPTGSCELDGLVVVCYLKDLGPTARSGDPSCAGRPAGRFRTCYGFTLTLNVAASPPLTATIIGSVPDPDSSTNSRVILADHQQPAPPASGQGAGVGGGTTSGGTATGGSAAGGTAAGGGSAGGGSVTGRGAASGATATGPPAIASAPATAGATMFAEPVNDRSAAVSAVAGGRTDADPGQPLTGIAVAVVGFLLGAGAGGAGLLLAWRRFRPRLATAADPAASMAVAEPGSADPASGVGTWVNP